MASYFLDVPTSEITLKDSSYLTLSFRGNDRKMITGEEVVFWTKQAQRLSEKLETVRLSLWVMELLLLNITGTITKESMLKVKP